ncbi:MAG: type II toxin-antitoxin system HicA family toxin [Thermodesulfobacteriota bacterium]
MLTRLSFKLTSQKGSHGKFKNETGKIVILPMNKKKYQWEPLKVY